MWPLPVFRNFYHPPFFASKNSASQKNLLPSPWYNNSCSLTSLKYTLREVENEINSFFYKNYWFTSSVVIYSCTPLIHVHVLKFPMKNIATEHKTGCLLLGQIIRIWKDNTVKILQSIVYAPLACPLLRTAVTTSKYIRRKDYYRCKFEYMKVKKF